MLEPFRLLTAPFPLTGPLGLPDLRSMIAVDALLRFARADGREAEWCATTLAGSLAGQRAVERELAREGSDRPTLGKDAFIARVRAFEARVAHELAEQMAALAVEFPHATGRTDDQEVVDVARVAFVRLFDQGLLERTERVVDVCPHCQTVVDRGSGQAASIESEALTVRLRLTNQEAGDEGAVDVVVVVPELLPGVVAVTVPDGHEAAGRTASIPLADRDVPVVADPEVEAPTLLVPAHVEADWEVARRLGCTPVEVVDADGVVRAAGPLDGLARFAARRAARDALDAAGLIVDSVPITEDVRKCGRCGAVLVPRLGAHWFLATQGLEAALADALREEAVAFAPPTVQDALVEALGGGREWCLSHQVWAGQAVPVARCLDCGQLAVEVEQGPSCGKCMGALQPDDDVLDADFVAALWPLAIAGWPADEQGVDAVAAHTTVVVDERGLELWVVPAAALALRLTGALPFRNVVVVEGGRTAASDDTAEAAPPDVVGLVDAEGARVVRAALVAGALDLDAARVTVDAIEAPPPGDDADTGDTVADLDTALDAAATAIAGGAPGVALDVLATALSSGARPTDAARAHALAGFVLGD